MMVVNNKSRDKLLLQTYSQLVVELRNLAEEGSCILNPPNIIYNNDAINAITQGIVHNY